jgi:aldehyde dehydrogenase (NAD+)
MIASNFFTMQFLQTLNISAENAGTSTGSAWLTSTAPAFTSSSPVDGKLIASVTATDKAGYDTVVNAACQAFTEWRSWPAPRRGEIVRQIGEALRKNKTALGQLVSYEMGKSLQEGYGEVQEMIDICDFAVGLSRQLHGLTIASERPGHRMMEQWHPLGPIGVISAFNFPVAVWAWNAMLALVCGDPVVWKPSEKAPLAAMACHWLASQAISDFPEAPPGLLGLVIGDGAGAGAPLAASEKLPLISATGSVRMGRAVARTVADRLGRSLLELGGNNGMILTPSADLELACRAIVFAAVGTCGQRCTTLRRLIVHESVAAKVIARLKSIYARLPIGDPRAAGVLVGPLIDARAGEAMSQALAAAADQGARIHGGGRITKGVPDGGVYVRPALVEISPTAPIVQVETFAPILYVMTYRNFDEALALHNGVPQGLSSAVFTSDVREAEQFMSSAGSDCGIANVNIGTSGAEIGGAFGGEKTTGGGRESGSDCWKNYMRRATNTVNYSRELPLAQGISFDVAD